MATGLVVPIRVEALLIGSGDAHDAQCFVPPTANFANFPNKGSYLGLDVFSQPFNGNGPLPAGVHLHWNLPRALRTGAVGEDGSVSTPSAPNRWLITRISQTGPSTVTCDSWVIESDYTSNDYSNSPTTIPQGTSYAYLGKQYTLSDWLAGGNSGQYLTPFTAMGYGIPEFAACYMNCRNVFGVLDPTPMASASAGGSISYVVVGWYQDPTLDPLYGQTIEGSGNSFGWLFSGAETPTYSIYYGKIGGIQYNSMPGYAYLPGWAESLDPQVAIGNSSIEALSALLTSGSGSSDSSETLLNALQLGLLQSLSQPDGVATMEAGIFNNSFATANTGSNWDVQPAQQASGAALYTDLSAALDQQLAPLLNQLNQLQAQLGAANAQAATLEGQIFADWIKFTLLEYNQGVQPPPDPTAVSSYISSEIEALSSIAGPAGTIDALGIQIEALKTTITSLLPASIVLTASPAPGSHGPADPVLLLSGDGIVAQPPDNADAIDCVLSSSIIAQVNLPDGLVSGSTPETLPVANLPAQPSAASLPYPEIGALVQISLLLDPIFSPVVTQAVAALGGASNPALLDAASTTSAISAAVTQYLAGQTPANGILFIGEQPQIDISTLTWTAEPWNPLALAWSFNFDPVTPGSNGYPAGFVTSNFQLTAADFNYSQTSQSFSGTLQAYSGSVLLSPTASASLGSQISQYLQHYPDQNLQNLLDQFLAHPFLAQSLGGFHQALYMLEPSLQLPPSDPNGFIFNQQLAANVAAAVGDQNTQTPMLNFVYNPIRAGQIQFRQINLIDEFGRFSPIDLDTMIVANTIPTNGGSPIQLAPPLRLAQHSQLLFQWLSAADSTMFATSLPSTSPICGWVVPNHLDDSLMFYDATGAALGSLTPANDGTSIVWQTAPGTKTPSTSMEDALALANPVLTAFAKYIFNTGAAYLQGLIETFDQCQSAMSPSSYAANVSTAVLLGAPLALVQASLDMQLLGFPQPNQSLSALNTDINNPPTDRTVNGFTTIQFPAILGNPGLVNDGLTGYYLQTYDSASKTWSTDFSTFYTYHPGSGSGIAGPALDTIQLTPQSGSPTCQVTMLVDPRAAVHASNGVSPVQELEVPPFQTSYAFSRMVYTFLTSPLLALASSLSIPIPAEASGTWSWVTYANQQWVQATPSQPNNEATLQNASRLVEGWLQLTPK